MLSEVTKKNMRNGALIYIIGDTIATIILGQFHWVRMLGIGLVGGLLYSIEIPAYFKFIDRYVRNLPESKIWLVKTLLATVFFNPLWLARHMFFIRVLSGKFDDINWSIFATATSSFFVNIPLSIIGNYIIQNKISLEKRFFASAIFSGIMAICYALSETFFA